MDRDITVRFYELRWPDDGPADIADAFRALQRRPRAERERPVNDNIVLRLDDFDEGDGLIWGDIVRVQSDNLPSHVQEDSSDPLPVERIGHHAAFIFEPETRFLALQFDAKIAVNHGDTFGTGGGAFLRFNVATPRARVAEAGARLQRAFGDLQ